MAKMSAKMTTQGGMRRMRRLSLSLRACVMYMSLVVVGCQGIHAQFHRGDTIPLARRAQYNQVRTEWHEILGRHCPHFGVDRVVALPLPKPTQFEPGDEYKLSLALDHHRYHTTWLKILDSKRNRAPVPTPMIDITLRHADDEITGFKAKIVPLSNEYVQAHEESIQHFRNETHWPKHVVVRYKWDVEFKTDISWGISLISIFGLFVSFYLMVNIIANSKNNLASFANTMSTNLDSVNLGADESTLKGE